MPARLRATTRKAAASRRIRSTGARRRSARGGEARVGIAIRSSSHESQGARSGMTFQLRIISEEINRSRADRFHGSNITRSGFVNVSPMEGEHVRQAVESPSVDNAPLVARPTRAAGAVSVWRIAACYTLGCPGIARVCCYNRARDWSEVNYGTKADKRSGERTRDDLAGPRRSRGGSLC